MIGIPVFIHQQTPRPSKTTALAPQQKTMIAPSTATFAAKSGLFWDDCN